MKKNLLLSSVLLFAVSFVSKDLICAVTEIKAQSDFDSKVKNRFDKKLVVVKFYLKDCGHCKVFKPKFNELSNNFSDIEFFGLEVDDVKPVSDKFGIRSVPVVIYFKDGKEISRTQKTDKNSITADINKLK